MISAPYLDCLGVYCLVIVCGLPEVLVAYSVCRNLEVEVLRADILYEVKSIVTHVRKSSNILTLGVDPVISKYRPFLKKHKERSTIRVYPEVLIKRLLSTGRFPQYNSVIDIANAVSTLTRIPISAIDVDRVIPPLKLVYLTKDAVVRDFRGKEVYVAQGSIVLEEGSGKIVYVFPYKTTDVAPVTIVTKNAVFIGYGAPGVPSYLVASSIKMIITYIESFIRDAQCSRLEVNASIEPCILYKT